MEAIPGDLSKNFTEVRFLEAELKDVYSQALSSIDDLLNRDTSVERRNLVARNLSLLLKSDDVQTRKKSHIAMYAEAITHSNVLRLEHCYQKMEMKLPNFFIPFTPEVIKEQKTSRPIRASRRRANLRNRRAKELLAAENASEEGDKKQIITDSGKLPETEELTETTNEDLDIKQFSPYSSESSANVSSYNKS